MSLPSLCLVSFSPFLSEPSSGIKKRKEPAGILQEPALDSLAVLLWTELFNLSVHSNRWPWTWVWRKQWHELNCDVKLNVRHIFAVTLSPTWDCRRSFGAVIPDPQLWPMLLFVYRGCEPHVGVHRKEFKFHIQSWHEAERWQETLMIPVMLRVKVYTELLANHLEDSQLLEYGEIETSLCFRRLELGYIFEGLQQLYKTEM